MQAHGKIKPKANDKAIMKRSYAEDMICVEFGDEVLYRCERLIRRPSDRKCKVGGDGYSNNAPLCVLAILHQVLLHSPTDALSVVYVPATAKHI